MSWEDALRILEGPDPSLRVGGTIETLERVTIVPVRSKRTGFQYYLAIPRQGHQEAELHPGSTETALMVGALQLRLMAQRWYISRDEEAKSYALWDCRLLSPAFRKFGGPGEWEEPPGYEEPRAEYLAYQDDVITDLLPAGPVEGIVRWLEESDRLYAVVEEYGSIGLGIGRVAIRSLRTAQCYDVLWATDTGDFVVVPWVGPEAVKAYLEDRFAH